MSREIVIDQWLREKLGDLAFNRKLLAGDASYRRYYRISSSTENWVLMDAPPPENPHGFIEVAKVLEAKGLSVPRVFASNLSQGFVLLSDFGDRLYLNELKNELNQNKSNDHNIECLYQDALLALVELNSCDAKLPVVDEIFLDQQWSIFKDWFLKKHLNIELTKEIEDLLNRTSAFFSRILLSQPYVFMHRDYHSRNLMVLEDGNPGILDFQDAMRGPITYDLVSLLQDCYIQWPREKILLWIKDYKQYATEARLLNGHESMEEFIRWFDLTGVTRHLKNCGIFSRLHHRDGRSQYLKDLSIPMNNLLESCDRYPELQGFSSFMKEVTLGKI